VPRFAKKKGGETQKKLAQKQTTTSTSRHMKKKKETLLEHIYKELERRASRIAYREKKKMKTKCACIWGKDRPSWSPGKGRGRKGQNNLEKAGGKRGDFDGCWKNGGAPNQLGASLSGGKKKNGPGCLTGGDANRAQQGPACRLTEKETECITRENGKGKRIGKEREGRQIRGR